MRYIDLDQIKKQLRMDALFADDDDLLEGLGDAAEDFVEAHLNKPLDAITAENSGEFPPALERAILMYVDYLYDTSGSGETRDVPQAFWVMTAPWKNYSIA